MLELINLALLIVLILLGIGIFIKFKKKDAELLKARMFLGKTLGNMWTYSSIAGVAFVTHLALRAFEQFFNVDTGIFLEISWTVFFLTFLLLTYEWYLLIKASVKRG